MALPPSPPRGQEVLVREARSMHCSGAGRGLAASHSHTIALALISHPLSIQACILRTVERGTSTMLSPSPLAARDIQFLVCAQQGQCTAQAHVVMLGGMAACHPTHDWADPPLHSGVFFAGSGGTWNQNSTVTITTSTGSSVYGTRKQRAYVLHKGGGESTCKVRVWLLATHT